MNTIVKYILYLAVLLALITSCATVGRQGDALVGDGEMVTKTVPCPEFTSLAASRCVRVRFVDSLTQTISVRADKNVMPYVMLVCEDKQLVATIDPKINSISDCTIEVVVPRNGRIGELRANSAARIDAGEFAVTKELAVKASSAARIDGDFTADELFVKASSSAQVNGSGRGREVELEGSSAGKIQLNLEAKRVSAEVSSSARISLCGTASYCDAEASSAGKLSCATLQADTVYVEASSNSRCDFYCSRLFSAKASSAARIHNHCHPEQALVKSSSGGKVESGCLQE